MSDTDNVRTLYVTDLDGTLLDSESRVDNESARIISELTRHGALITVATARTPATVAPLLAHTATSLPAIVMTGAASWLRDLRRYDDVCYIPAGSCEVIGSLFRAHAVDPFIYTIAGEGVLEVFRNGCLSDKDRRFVEERAHGPLKRFCFDDIRANRCVMPSTVLYFAMGPLDTLGELAGALRATGLCSVSFYTDIFGRDTGIIEVFAPDVSKAAAIERMRERTGSSRLVVFGDNLNDLPMMAVADVAVAVDNAVPEVKAAADIVIGPNTSGSVARFIRDDYR
ncbi:MAG: HAD family hydrolase [Pseudoflavonifractor sp.]|nr:HAD family hydrolase [Pseudoflavonifractor sp.]